VKNLKQPYSTVSTETLNFLKDNVLSVTDLTRKNKLAEILNQYAVKESSDVYVIQNHKKKDAQAVLLDLDYFQKLLKYEEIVEEALDDDVLKTAMERKNDKADLSLDDVISEDDFDYETIMKKLEGEDVGDQ
jgi:hypothetical protein